MMNSNKKVIQNLERSKVESHTNDWKMIARNCSKYELAKIVEIGFSYCKKFKNK